ncbi:MAG TPA: sulfatase-like hydrolase/transferase, partial [Chloroflexota bacterium]|nr:sulfatase-like hydrolase/transferase [Chloroflexota bacterium]
MTRPNILIILPDELRADALGCAGHPVYRTPHVDRLAREGVRFTNAYCTGPLCMPARASMISGLYPHNHGVQENAGSLPADDESYARLLRDAGYATAYVGKTHFGSDAPGRDFVAHEAFVRQRGFDYIHQIPGPAALTKTDNHLTRRWAERGLLEKYREDYRRRAADGGAGAWASPLPLEEFADSYVGAKAEEWLRGYDDHRPFLFVVGFGGPHPPFDAPEPYASMYDPAAIPDPIPPEKVPDDWERRAQIAKERMANYGGKISLIDDRVGRILAILDERGWTENTLVIFLSDHGEMGGDHGRYHKSVFFEGAARIPFIVRWTAALPAGTRVDAPIEQLDLFATVVEAGGAPPSARAFARSLLPLARGDGDAPARDAVFSELKRQIMIRTQRHKYVVDAEGAGLQLFDLREDPTERRNLVGHAGTETLERELRD